MLGRKDVCVCGYDNWKNMSRHKERCMALANETIRILQQQNREKDTIIAQLKAEASDIRRQDVLVLTPDSCPSPIILPQKRAIAPIVSFERQVAQCITALAPYHATLVYMRARTNKYPCTTLTRARIVEIVDESIDDLVDLVESMPPDQTHAWKAWYESSGLNLEEYATTQCFQDLVDYAGSQVC